MNLFRRKKEPRPARTEFEAVVAAYEGKLIVYVARITGSRSSAEDVVQEAFIKLSQHWRGGLSPNPAVSAWLYKAAYHAAVDHIRRERTRAATHERHAAEREIEEEERLLEPDGKEKENIMRKIRAALAALPERERSLVVLKVYENKSYNEIAEITGLKTGNVGYILHTAMKKLAKIILQKEGGDGT